MNFNECVEIILEHEGGYSNISLDPGGETNFGISKKAYPAVNISTLTKKQAIDIYKRDYWDKNRLDEFPECIKLIYFDCCVNQGPGRARQLYQLARTLNKDGGELTLLEHFAKARLNHYTILPGWKTFGAGWAKRLMSIVIESYLEELL